MIALKCRLALAGALLCGASLLARAEAPPDRALWNQDRSAAVAATISGGASRIEAFVRQGNGSYLTIDLSEVESRNLGKLGVPHKIFDRVHTVPVKWLPRDDGLLQVTIQTRVWRGARRYTAVEHIIFGPDGQVRWR